MQYYVHTHIHTYMHTDTHVNPHTHMLGYHYRDATAIINPGTVDGKHMCMFIILNMYILIKMCVHVLVYTCLHTYQANS